MSRRGRAKTGRPVLLLLAVAAGAAGALLLRARWVDAPAPSAAVPPGPTPATARESAEPKSASPAVPRRSARSAPSADFESASEHARPLLALVLDDMGFDEAALGRLAAFETPLAVAVIPASPHARQAAELARTKRWDLLVHLPMAPESGPAEKGSIGPEDGDEAIAERVTAALARVPGAIGVNNHQGSKATADARVMRAVLTVLRRRGLFFLDSRTTAATVGEREARAMGIPALSRDVFLDDATAETTAPGGASEALAGAWRQALETASRKGQCVVIGHPHASTLEFLAARLPELRRVGVEAVRVSELLQ